MRKDNRDNGNPSKFFKIEMKVFTVMFILILVDAAFHAKDVNLVALVLIGPLILTLLYYGSYDGPRKNKIESQQNDSCVRGIQKSGDFTGGEQMTGFGEALETKGEVRGIAKGEDKLAKLMNLLLSEGRIEDALKASSDKEARKRLYEEKGINDEN